MSHEEMNIEGIGCMVFLLGFLGSGALGYFRYLFILPVLSSLVIVYVLVPPTKKRLPTWEDYVAGAGWFLGCWGAGWILAYFI